MNQPANEDRRQRRSEVPARASELYLEHLADRFECEAISISTPDGLLFSGTGEGYDLDLLGAIASLGPEIGGYEPEQQRAANGHALRFYTLDFFGTPLSISSVGGAPLPIDECAAALRRIHSSLRPS